MFEEGSLAAKLVIVVLVTVGVAATVWFQGRTWENGPRLWHGAIFGVVAGVLVAFAALS